jgi:hypothetical protein
VEPQGGVFRHTAPNTPSKSIQRLTKKDATCQLKGTEDTRDKVG